MQNKKADQKSDLLFFYLRNSTVFEPAWKNAAILSNVFIADLQKIHLAPTGFFSVTSKLEIRYCDPWQHGQRKWIRFVMVNP